MKKQMLAVGVVCLSLLAISAKNADPTIMTVAGKNIPLSEFEYLFNKNNRQQANPQSVEDYVGMFVDYKLKVADAEAVGLDTTQAFIDEFTKFRDELSEPYLKDNSAIDSLMTLLYEHLKEDILVSHIMLKPDQQAKADSIRNAIIDGKISYEEAAKKFSIDRHSSSRGGLMGIVFPMRYPWSFEEASYNTKIGELSPVINSGVGLHIIRIEERTPAKGEVNAEHILVLTRGLSPKKAEAQKAKIDSIYNVAKANPDQFEDLAKRFSEDPGSAAKGGALGWFGTGVMVAEFDSTAFALPVGVISEPFQTAYGWHIIKKIDARGIGDIEDYKPKMLQHIDRTELAQEPTRAFIAKQKAILGEAKIKELEKNLNGQTLDEAILDLARQNLYNSNAEYRNLINEYRDGILLFEISNQNVWDKASKDKEGLENYFKTHREEYKWDAPKFKAYVIFADNDSTLKVAMDYAQQTAEDITPTEFAKYMRDRFAKEVKVERVIAAKGDNKITDYLAFGAEKPEPQGQRWRSYAAFRGRVIDAPEEAADMRGQVVSDYQGALEKAWLDYLHNKYKVKVNKKVLKQVK